MKRLWYVDYEYGLFIWMFIIVMVMCGWDAISNGPNYLNSFASLVTSIIIWKLVALARKSSELQEKVNKFLGDVGCVAWVEYATPVFRDGELQSVVVELTQYLLSGEPGKYSVGQSYVDEQVTVYVINISGQNAKKLVVVVYLSEVDVFSN
jgi:hypothetical protein